MRKIASILVCLILVLTVSGCNIGKKQTNTAPPTTTTSVFGALQDQMDALVNSMAANNADIISIKAQLGQIQATLNQILAGLKK